MSLEEENVQEIYQALHQCLNDMREVRVFTKGEAMNALLAVLLDTGMSIEGLGNEVLFKDISAAMKEYLSTSADGVRLQ